MTFTQYVFNFDRFSPQSFARFVLLKGSKDIWLKMNYSHKEAFNIDVQAMLPLYNH